ncbi:hypothetical protein [Enterococcus gallinarum]|uniref:hypothetical protein n=1 Tax=Enterococcus gallinarum TaxID=1353 RepID=UPI003D6ACF4F
MTEELFECGKCGDLTPLVKGIEYLGNEIKHEFFTCQKCHSKTTILVSDKTLRNMLLKQQNTKPGKRKIELAQRITERVEMLNDLARGD